MKKLIALFMTVLLLFTAVGCNRQKSDDDYTETVLRIANYDGGVGANWLEPLAREFEEKYAGKEMPDGKTGLKIIITNSKDYAGALDTKIQNSDNVIWFSDQNDYNFLAKSGTVMEITDSVVKADLGDVDSREAGKTIEDKLFGGANSQLNIDGKYYGLPHYSLVSCISYDRDLFFEKALFISKDSTNGNVIFTDDEDEFSVGCDGEYGTYDDGLPTTQDEFFELCAEIRGYTIDPIIVSGQYPHYYNNLGLATFLNCLTAEQLSAYYTLDSGETTLPIITDWNGDTPVVENKVIKSGNGQDTRQAKAIYDAIEFSARLFENPDNFSTYSSNSMTSHIAAQQYFLESKYKSRRIAMIIEGSHWYNEAVINGKVDAIAETHPEITTRNFAIMPTPWSDTMVTEGNGKKLTLTGNVNSYAFIANKYKDDELKVDLATEFLKFCYTEENLGRFSQITGVRKALNYTTTDEQRKAMTPYGKSVTEAYENAQIAYVGKDCKTFLQNYSKLHLGILNLFGEGVNLKSVFDGMDEDKMPAKIKEIFSALKIEPQRWSDLYGGQG